MRCRLTSQLSRSIMTQANGHAPSAAPKFAVSNRIQRERSKGLDVWSVFSPLSGYVPKDSINLGQGFMNWEPPKFAQDGVAATLDSPISNHYSIPKGRINLRKAISNTYSESFRLGRDINPETEILVTSGANLGTFNLLMTYVHPGDEVIVFEPFFDQYTPNIRMVEGVPICVPMRPPKNAASSVTSASEWRIDPQDLEKAVTPRTKIILLNSPHNPSGKVMTEQEIKEVGRIATKHNLMIISDEVYDYLAIPPAKHVRTAALDDLWQRTITVGSGGKTFAATGWRIGWLVGPEALIAPIIMANTRTTFSANSPMQEALAHALTHAGKFDAPDGFYAKQNAEYKERRDVLCAALDELGLPYSKPDGSYFILVNIARLQIPSDFEVLDIIKHKPKDWHAAWFLAKTVGIVTIPPSDFYAEEHSHIGADYLRLAFCKDVKTLKAAGERLVKLKPYLKAAA